MKILALFLASTTMAIAADLPVLKAPAQSSLLSGYPYAASGIYWGLNSFAAAGSATASAPGLNSNSLITNQASVGFTLGYVWATPQVFYAIEAMFDFTNLNGAAPGLSLGGPAAFEQRLKLGTPLNNFLSLFPSLGLPTVPPFPTLSGTAVATNIHPYLMLGLHEDDISLNFGLGDGKQWQVSPSVGIGMMGQLTNGVAIDTWAEAIIQNKSICVGPAMCVKQDTKYQIGLGIYY